MATDELASKLHKRTVVIDTAEEGGECPPAEQPSMKVFNVYTEFKEFTRKEIKHYQSMFNLWVNVVTKNGRRT